MNTIATFYLQKLELWVAFKHHIDKSSIKRSKPESKKRENQKHQLDLHRKTTQISEAKKEEKNEERARPSCFSDPLTSEKK